jgi:hypothetical protein
MQGQTLTKVLTILSPLSLIIIIIIIIIISVSRHSILINVDDIIFCIVVKIWINLTDLKALNYALGELIIKGNDTNKNIK